MLIKPGLKIAYLSVETPTNKRVWSGTHYSIYKALSAIGKVEILGPYEPKFQVLIGKLINQLYLRISGKRFDYRHSFLIAKNYGKHFTKKIEQSKPDLIIAPAASSELAFLKTNIPVIYITDGTFASCLNYHKSLTNLLTSSVKEGNTIEKRAIDNARTVIVSSDWAARSVENDYKATKDKIITIPYGANFEKLPKAEEINYAPPVEWKLLFVGVYWESKGGDIAFNAFKILADKGYNISMTVLGCIPPSEVSHPKLTVIPFIDKNDDEGQKRLVEIYQQHHFLILPTRFDCTPIVINEASAFGIPSLVANSGGVAGHLKEGENGFLLDYKDQGEGYAKKLETLMVSPEDYLSLRKKTRKLFEEKLNWEHWATELKKLI